MVSRRQLLTGDFSGRRTAPAPDAKSLRPVFGADCLPERGVVCRSCGEVCAPGAISFSPTHGGVSKPRLDASTCKACGDCVAICPVNALQLAAPGPGNATTSGTSLTAPPSRIQELSA